MDVLLEFTDGPRTTLRTWFANGTANLTEAAAKPCTCALPMVPVASNLELKWNTGQVIL